MGVSVSVYVLKQLHSSGARALLNRTNGTRRRKEGERRDLADTESSCQQSTDPRDGGGGSYSGAMYHLQARRGVVTLVLSSQLAHIATAGRSLGISS
jgi:hypothetical protein